MQPDQPAVPDLTGETARRWAAVQPASGETRVIIGDIPERAGLVAGLRSLADYLAVNPAVPVPPDGEQFCQVDLVAEFMGERPADRREATGRHYMQRSFGPASYESTAIAD
jgi:hypothetical protein